MCQATFSPAHSDEHVFGSELINLQGCDPGIPQCVLSCLTMNRGWDERRRVPDPSHRFGSTKYLIQYGYRRIGIKYSKQGLGPGLRVMAFTNWKVPWRHQRQERPGNE